MESVALMRYSGRNSDRIRHLRQSVQITGLGAEEFNVHVNNVIGAQAFLAAHFGYEDYDCSAPSKFESAPAIDASTRYLSSKRQDPTSDTLDIPPEIDPHGVLTNAIKQDLFYGEDNRVLYLEVLRDGDKEK